MPFDQPVVSPILVGRTTQVELLVDLIKETRNQRGQVVTIAGEAGIGKSRLVHEVRMNAHRYGVPSSLEGRCFEPDRSLPYAPLIDLLRMHFGRQSPDEIVRQLGSAASEVARILPELAPLLPQPIPDTAEPEQAKRRLYEAVIAFLNQFSSPLLLSFEDIHWSDDASLEFLAYLAHRSASLPILMVLTYRTEEEQPSLKRFLAELDRNRRSAEISLSRLTSTDVELMIRTILVSTQPAPSDFVDAIYTLTEGNPFFVEEILKSLLTTGALSSSEGGWDRQQVSALRIPRSVQVAVQRRVDRISEDARQVLHLAAVAGRRFDFALLRYLSGYDELTLEQLLKELLNAQLVVEESAESFAFRHALTQHAVYTDLLARERRSLHGQVAAAIERLYSDQLEVYLSELSYHYFAAQVWDNALTYAERAGRGAQRLNSPSAATQHFSRALEAAHKLGLPPQPHLLAARGQAYDLLGEFEAAQRDYEQRLVAAESVHDATEEWQALLDLGWLWTNRDYNLAGRYFERAITLARGSYDPTRLAQTLNRVGNWHLHSERPLEALASHREALSVFESSGDKSGQAATLDLLAVTSMIAGDVLGSAVCYQRAIGLFRELADWMGLSGALAVYSMRGASYNLDSMVCPVVSQEDCERESDEAVRLAQRIGWRSGEASALLYQAFGLGPRGAYQKALASALAAVEITGEIGHRQWAIAAHLVAGAIYADLFAFIPAREHHETAYTLAKAMGSSLDIGVASGFLASTYVALGELARAEVILKPFQVDAPPLSLALRKVRCAQVELALARREYHEVLSLTTRLIESTPNTNLNGSVIPYVWLLQADARAGLAQGDKAEELLLAARDQARAQGTPLMLWRVLLRLGKLYLGKSRREQAEDELVDAQALRDTLAEGIDDTNLREQFLHHTSNLMPRGTLLSPRQSARKTYGGLTEREREVARLIAEGKSNLTIASEPVLSRRTVEKHVDNIMSKLGVTSRAQIAVWTIKKGLS